MDLDRSGPVIRAIDATVGTFLCGATIGLMVTGFQFGGVGHWVEPITRTEAWLISIAFLSMFYCGFRCAYLSYKQ